MSLPPATKSIDAKPAKNAVTDPTDKAILEKDVDRKMRMYGVIQAFRNGRMPDNAQIDETLKYFIANSPVEISKLSPEGTKLIEDIRAILETSRVMIQDKNADEVLQQFIYHTSDQQFRERAVKHGQTAIPDESNLPHKDSVKQDSEQAVQHIRTLAQLLLTNSEARKLIQDFTLIGRDLFAQGASRAAERARPSPEKLAKVDDAAPNSPVGATAPGELGPMEGGIDIQKDGFRGSLKKGLGNAQEKAAETAEEPKLADNEALKQGGLNARDAAASHAQDVVDKSTTTRTNPDGTQSQVVDTGVAATETKAKAKYGFSNFSNRVPDKHKERAKDEVRRARDFFDEEFPQERRDQFIWRMKKVVTECQSHPSYQEAISWFLSSIEAYFSQAKTVGTNQSNTAKGLFSNDPVLNQAWKELRVLLERFAGGRSLDGIFGAIEKLWNDGRDDQEFRSWWKRADEFVRKTLLEPGFILSPQFSSQSQAIFHDQAREFFDVRYKDHRDLLSNEGQEWVNGWTTDPLNKRLTDNWATLVKDLLLNDNGNLTWKPMLWHDIRKVILPSLIEQVGYVPIPRIEYTDDKMDLVIENLTLQGRNLFPNIIEVAAQTYMKMSPYSAIKDESHHTMTVTLSQIQADMRDVTFYYKKKTGFAKLKDSGLADVFLGGNGITATVTINNNTSSSKASKKSLFQVKSVHVKVDALKFSIRDSRHDLLYKTLRPLATGLIKKQVAKAIEDGIRFGFEYADRELVKVRERVAQAQTAEGSKMDALKTVFTKTSDTGSMTAVSGDEHSPERTVSRATSKAEKRNSKFKIVPKRESMLLPDVGHEKGWIRKASEKDDKATEGEGWKSSAFSILPTNA
jgi:hypothetical protein